MNGSQVNLSLATSTVTGKGKVQSPLQALILQGQNAAHTDIVSGRAVAMAQSAESLLGVHEALNSVPSTT